jgi:hypothetical protein
MQKIQSVKDLIQNPIFHKLLIDHPCLIPDDFDWNAYINNSPDLMHIYEFTTEIEAKIHYMLYGKSEHRNYKKKLSNDETLTLKQYENILHNYKFNPKIYKILNVDLSYFSDQDATLHFLRHGIQEKREYLTDYEYGDILEISSKSIDKIQKTDILLINHSSSLTGAPKALVNIYHHLIKQNLKVLFVDILPTNALNVENQTYHLNNMHLLKQIINKSNPSKIYSNSLNIYLLYISKFIEELKYTTLYFHETYNGFSIFTKDKYNNLLKNQPIYVVTEKIKNEFISKGFTNIHISPPFLPTEEQSQIDLLKQENIDHPIVSINGKYPLDMNKIIIGMCGTVCKRKNFDLFANLCSKHSYLQFLWIGADSKKIDDEYRSIKNLFIVPATKNPYKYFNILDYFFLTSISDPCPFVVLENLYMNKKIIVLDKNIHYEHPKEKLENFIVLYDHNNDINTISKKIKNLNLNKLPNKTTKNIDYIVQEFSTPKIILDTI